MREIRPTITQLRARIRGALRSTTIVVPLLLAAALYSPAAAAQQVCGDRADIVDKLEQQYSERPQAMGLSTDGQLLEVLVSPSGSWTILVTYPNRLTCLVSTGENWESLRQAASGVSA